MPARRADFRALVEEVFGRVTCRQLEPLNRFMFKFLKWLPFDYTPLYCDCSLETAETFVPNDRNQWRKHAEERAKREVRRRQN